MIDVFPVTPSTLSFKPDDNAIDSNETYNNKGIISEDYLKGILTEISFKVGKVCTIIEKRNDVWIGTEAFSIENDINPICKNVRKDNEIKCKENLCFCSVEKHIKVLEENSHIRLKKDIILYKDENDVSSVSFLGILKPNYRLLNSSDKITTKSKKKNFTLFEYNCPVLGFREIIVPLKIGKTLIGYFSTGQIIRSEDIELIRKKVSELKKNKIFISKDELEKINSFAIDSKKYQKLLIIIIAEIDRLLIRVKRELYNYRCEYIRENFELFIQSIHENNSEIVDNLHDFWQNNRKVFLDLNKLFPVNHITIFACKNYQMKEVNSLPIAFSTLDSVSKRNIVFDFSRLDNKSLSIDLNTEQKDGLKLFECLKEDGKEIKLVPKVDFIRFRPSINGATTFVVWVCYNNEKWNHLLHRKLNYEIVFTQNIKALYAIIGQKFESIWSRISQSLVRNMLLAITHEVPQTLLVFSSFRRYIRDKESFNRLSESRRRDFYNQYEAMIYQLKVLPQTAKSIIDGDIKLNPENFKGFKELIFAWKDAFIKDLQHKKIAFSHPNELISQSARGYVYADKEYLRQVMNNLYDNAKKYCIRGSTIYTDINLIKDYYVVRVTDYADFKISTSNKIYGIGIRTPKTENSQGNGFGLFLVNLVTKAHYGNLTHIVNKIADYNLPMIDEYLLNCKNKEDEDYDIIKQYKLDNKDLISRVVARSPFNELDKNLYIPTESTIKKNLRKPIYEITFIVKLSIEENYLNKGGYFAKK